MKKRYTHKEFMQDISDKSVKEACTTLYENYKWYVFKEVNSFLDFRGHNAEIFRDDLIQIIWYQICDHVDKYSKGKISRPYSALPTFIGTIVQNTCFNYFNRANQKFTTSLEDLCDEIPQVEQVTVKVENNERLEKAFNTLSDIERKIVFLIGEGDTYQQIAEKTGISVSCARTKIFRVRQSLNKTNK